MPFFPEFSPAFPAQPQQPATAGKKSFFKRLGHLLVLFFCALGLLFFTAIATRVYSVLKPYSPAVFKEGTILRLNLEDELFETRPGDFIGSLTFGNPPTVSDVVSGLNRAAKDKNIQMLVAYMTKSSLSLTQIQEIRQAVLAFKQAGKKTVFFAPTIGELGGGLGMYYLAAAFDDIRIQPSGEIGTAGIAIESPYLRKTLLKFGITPSFNARYEYKSGADTLNADKMSDSERENLTQILDSFLTVMAEDIAKDRKITSEKMKTVLQNGPYFAQTALEMKLIDKIEYADVLERELKEKNTEIVDLLDYATMTEPRIKSKTPVIAYVPAIGVIQFGDSVFGGDAYRSILGFSSFSDTLRTAADDHSVKAIVIRLDSPGGGYTSSDAMRREIEYVKQMSKKPVVCSMGSSAASGGYFISLGCDKVLADPATLTGSIGVFGGKLVFTELLKKLDVTISSLKMGKNAGMFSMVEDFSPEQKKFFDDSLDCVYQDFTAKVAERRGFSPKKMNALARGRVFTGAQAAKNGLIDGIGGLSESVKAASEMAGMKETLPLVEYPSRPTRLEMLVSLLNSDTAIRMKKQIGVQGILPALKTWAERMSSGDLRLFYAGFKSL